MSFPHTYTTVDVVCALGALDPRLRDLGQVLSAVIDEGGFTADSLDQLLDAAGRVMDARQRIREAVADLGDQTLHLDGEPLVTSDADEALVAALRDGYQAARAVPAPTPDGPYTSRQLPLVCKLNIRRRDVLLLAAA